MLGDDFFETEGLSTISHTDNDDIGADWGAAFSEQPVESTFQGFDPLNPPSTPFVYQPPTSEPNRITPMNLAETPPILQPYGTINGDASVEVKTLPKLLPKLLPVGKEQHHQVPPSRTPNNRVTKNKGKTNAKSRNSVFECYGHTFSVSGDMKEVERPQKREKSSSRTCLRCVVKKKKVRIYMITVYHCLTSP